MNAMGGAAAPHVPGRVIEAERSEDREGTGLGAADELRLSRRRGPFGPVRANRCC
jgi:hypothetical protein